MWSVHKIPWYDNDDDENDDDNDDTRCMEGRCGRTV